jgi:aminoglycoside phosphotransferase (APT) family kinase protein
MVGTDVVEVVRRLHRDPGPLCRALALYPNTLVHGDAYPGNIGLPREAHGKVILLDWQLATALPPAVDLTQCLSDFRVVAKEAAIAHYRHSLARQLGGRYDDAYAWWRPQLALGALAFFVSRGWAIPLFIERWSAGERERATWRATLAWFAGQIRAAAKWL